MNCCASVAAITDVQHQQHLQQQQQFLQETASKQQNGQEQQQQQEQEQFLRYPNRLNVNVDLNSNLKSRFYY